MLNADRAPYFHTCPRCGEGAFEKLATHNHCVNCNYAEDKGSGEYMAIPNWALKIVERIKSTRASGRIDEDDLGLFSLIRI